MKDIAIYCAGGFGREIACLLRRINEAQSEPVWNLIGYFDDGVEKGTMISHYAPVLGGMAELNAWDKEIAVTIAIGNSIVVKKIVEKITNPNIEFPNLIHPNFFVSDPETFCIGKGNIIQGNCTATCNVSIGDFNIFNGSVVMGHDVNVGNFNTFMPAVRVSGEVKIGEYNFFGVGSIILQQIKIGNKVRLGAGSVLMTKPKEGFLYLGVPAKKTEI